MHVFLQYVFNLEKLRESVREDWIQLYDFSYIDEKILGGIERNLPNVAEILGVVEKKATGHVVSSLTTSSFNMAAVAKGSQGDESTMMKSLMGNE